MTRGAPVPTTNAVAISREVKQFTSEIARGLKNIGTSLFSHSIYALGFAFLLQADRQLTTDRRKMQCPLRCTVGPTSSSHVIRNAMPRRGLNSQRSLADPTHDPGL